MATVHVTDATFQAEVLQSEIPVLVDFWATWCAPCKQVAPILEELSDAYAGRVKIVKVDVDANPMLSQQLRIQSIPTLVVFDQGRPVDAVQGALPKEALEELLNKYVPEMESTTIKVDDLAARLQAGLPVQVFDIRDARDVSRSHLRKARCVPVESLVQEISALPPGTMVVLVDRTGEGSAEAVKVVADAVPNHVVALEKGLLEWEGSGQPTYNDREEAALDAAT